ncbi:MAG: hypothetical protein JWM38_1246 [Sphingomonas bacterium]|nr:hypothetical protein [Sphingomonas bacterium]MDB5717819.1 hypothetical protein [Sphingomonas bacterium]
MIRPVAKLLTALVAVALIAGGAGWFVSRQIGRSLAGPDPVSIASASLQSMQEQNRLTPFAARYVAVVTSTQRRFGLSARKTLIMPGNVRYEVDLGKLRQQDVRWNAGEKRLSVMLPPIELAGPEVDLAAMREYDGGGVLLRLSDAATRLDMSNRAAGQRELLAQARGPVPMRLARDAARRAVERSFAMPLRAAGLDATVQVLFADERGSKRNPDQLDRSRSLDEIYANKAA